MADVPRDPEVKAALDESHAVLERNRQLVKELAAVERALKERAWTSRSRTKSHSA